MPPVEVLPLCHLERTPREPTATKAESKDPENLSLALLTSGSSGPCWWADSQFSTSRSSAILQPCRGVAQPVEHLVRDQGGGGGSNPLSQIILALPHSTSYAAFARLTSLPRI